MRNFTPTPMSSNSEFTIDQTGGQLVIRFPNSVLSHTLTADRIGTKLFQHIAETDATEVIVDFGDDDHVSSDILGGLVGIFHHVRQHGGHVRLVGAKGALLRAIEQTHLDKILTLHQSIEEAIAA